MGKIDGEMDKPLEPRISWPIWSYDHNAWPFACAFRRQTFKRAFVKRRMCPKIASGPILGERVIFDGIIDRKLSIMVGGEEVNFVYAPEF